MNKDNGNNGDNNNGENNTIKKSPFCAYFSFK